MMGEKREQSVCNKTNIQELFEMLKDNRRLIVYGVGREFPKCIEKIRLFCRILCDEWDTPGYVGESERGRYPYSYEDIVNYIDFAIDNNREMIEKTGGGYYEFEEKRIKIYDHDYLHNIDLSKYVIIITTKDYEDSIRANLCADGIEGFGFFSDMQHYEKKCRGLIIERVILPYMKMIKMEYYTKNNVKSEKEEYRCLIKTIGEGGCVINFVSVDITTVCNLRCKNCVDYIPYLKEHCHYSAENIISDINNFFNAIDMVYCVSLGSAEVLFHPMIKDILKCILSFDRIERIDLVTNGVAYPKDKELLDILREPRIMLHMSNYGIPEKTDVSRRFYEEQGIDIRFMYGQSWREQSTVFYDRFLNKEDKEYIYMNCDQAKVCNHFLTAGKYYTCGKIRRIIELSDFSSDHDYIDIGICQKDELKQKLMKQQLEPFMDACSWCDWHEQKTEVRPGEQLD